MKLIRTSALLLALVMLLSCFAACGKKTDSGESEGEKIDAGVEIDATKVVWTKNFTVTKSMMTYFFNYYYRNFATTYEKYLSYMKLDVTKKLSEQKYSDDYSWYEYILLQASTQVNQSICLAEEALSEGFELDGDDYDDIESGIVSLNTAAQSSGYTNAGYINALFGTDVNEATIRKCMKLQLLAQKANDDLLDSYDFSGEECEAQFSENLNSYLYFDYIRAVVSEKNAAELSECKDEKSFTDTLKRQIADDSFGGDYYANSVAIDELVEAKYSRRVAYNKDSEFIVWAFDSARVKNELFTKAETDGSGSVSVCMLLGAEGDGAYSDVLYRDTESVRNLKYILIDEKQSGSADNALEKANSIYDEYLADESEENFDRLSKEYSGSVSNDIVRGELAKKLNNWIFDSDRKTGDCEVISIENTGAYVLYMLDNGEPAWICAAKSALSDAKFKEDIDALSKKYAADYDSSAIGSLSEITIG